MKKRIIGLSLTLSLTHSLTHSLTYSLTHSGLRGDLWTQLLIDEFQLHSELNPADFVGEWECNMAEHISSNGVSVLPGGSAVFPYFTGYILNHPLPNQDTR